MSSVSHWIPHYELHCFQILTKGLLAQGMAFSHAACFLLIPQSMHGQFLPNFSRSLSEAKVICWSWGGIAKGTGLQQGNSAQLVGSGGWLQSSDKSHPRGAGAGRCRWGAPHGQAAGGGRRAQPNSWKLQLAPSPPSPGRKLCPCCSLGFLKIQAICDLSLNRLCRGYKARSGEAMLRRYSSTLLSPAASWLWLTNIGIWKTFRCVWSL